MNNLLETIKRAIWGESQEDLTAWCRWIHTDISDKHCITCLRLHECWFHKDKAPISPRHPFCHCHLSDLSSDMLLKYAVAKSDYGKFDPYLFNTNNKYNHNKELLFKSWGYTALDAKWLQTEIEKQGLQKYISGNYSLGNLNEQGQRISIKIEIPRKDNGENVSFVTGWMVYPYGQIQLTTPYGGK